MLQVDQVDPKIVDSWDIVTSGLPSRVVNSVVAVGVTRVGELRTWSDTDLLNLRSLGRISLGHIHDFFRVCDQISAGIQRFEVIDQVLKIFLDDDEVFVLSSRYGLDRPDLAASNNFLTLQQIGNQTNRTRERVRQVEEVAKTKLHSKLAQVCLQPFYDFFRATILELGKTASCSDVRSLQQNDHLAGRNPCSLMLLLSELDPSKITFYNDFFSVLRTEQLKSLEEQALTYLQGCRRPVHLADVTSSLGDIPYLASPREVRQTMGVILDHQSEVAATTNGRYFLFKKGTASFLLELMKTLQLPIHYRGFTNVVNDHLKPRSRKGPGFILKTLNAEPAFARVERGIYTLKEPGPPVESRAV